MFCPKCAYELPAVAKFCVRCGSRVEAPATQHPAIGSFCVNCGRPYDSSYKFCNYCGHPVPQPKTQNEPATAAENESVPPMQILDSAAAVSHPPEATTSRATQKTGSPYAVFTVWYLVSTMLFSCAVFIVAYVFGADSWGNMVMFFLVAVLLAGLASVIACCKVWNRIVANEDDAGGGFRRRRRRVLLKAIAFVLVFFMISAVVGNIIGQNGVEAAQVNSDLLQVKTLGDRISKSRTPDGSVTISWYIQMYRSIEPDVNHLDAVLRRLAAEYPSYDAKFPHEDSHKSETISGFQTGIRRMALIKKQIAVAKKIDEVDQSDQMTMWQMEMRPVLDEEEALDKSK
jgi:hypothetical protein